MSRRSTQSTEVNKGNKSQTINAVMRHKLERGGGAGQTTAI